MTISNLNRRSVINTDIWLLHLNLTKIRQRQVLSLHHTHHSLGEWQTGFDFWLLTEGVLVVTMLLCWHNNSEIMCLLYNTSFIRTRNMNNWSLTRCETLVCVTGCLLHVTQQFPEMYEADSLSQELYRLLLRQWFKNKASIYNAVQLRLHLSLIERKTA